MKSTMQGYVVGGKRYEMDGNKGGTLYLSQHSSGDNPNIFGDEVIKMSISYDLITEMGPLLPAVCDIEFQIAQGAQDKAKLVCLGLKPSKSGRPASTDNKAA